MPFKIEDWFQKLDLKILKKNFNKRKDVSPIKTTEFNLPLINAKFGDNGIMFYGREADFESAEMCIDIVQNGAIATGKVYAQPQKTGVLWDAYLIKPLFSRLSVEILLYVAKCLEKSIQEKFNYDNKAIWDRVKNEYVMLPSSNGKTPDIDYMESRIRELEESRIRELEELQIRELSNYLKVSGLKNYTLTEEEQKIITKNVRFKEFKLGDIFELKSPKKRFNANSVTVIENPQEGFYKYIVRTSSNNGANGYIKADEQYLSPAHTISLGQDTATIFYQEVPYYTGDKIKILTFKFGDLKYRVALYLISVMRKAFSCFTWGQSSFNESILNNIKINLPCDENELLNISYIETYITAHEKLSIKDVVDYKNLIINTTKQVVQN